MSKRHTVYLLTVVVLCVLTAAPSWASFLGNDLYVLSVGRGSGAAGSQWYTTMWFHNPGEESVMVTVSYLPRGTNNIDPDQQVFSVPAGSTVTYGDALNDLFEFESAVGALRIQTAGQVAVGSRVFNQPGASISESQGQLMSGIPASFSVQPGGVVEVPGVLMPADESFRSNFGMVETSGATTRVKATLLDGQGVEIGTRNYTLAPFAAFQRSIADLSGGVRFDEGILRIEVIGNAGAVLAYASAVASGVDSQDPTTLGMTLDPELLGGGTTSGISEIQAGPGLAGGGTEGVVSLRVVAGDGIEVSTSGVAVKNEGITGAHIAPGELVHGLKVEGRTLADEVTLEAGSNITIESAGNDIEISAFSCLGERLEVPVTQALDAGTQGTWYQGGDQLTLPSAGRWRVGYRALVQITNNGVATVSDPINIALYDATHDEILRSTLAVVGQQIDLVSTVFATVSMDTVIDVDRATAITIVARTSRSDLLATVHAHDVDLSQGLPNPDASSFLYYECISLD